MREPPLRGSGKHLGRQNILLDSRYDREENAQETVDADELGYQPLGSGLCVFFGPIPLSSGNEIKPTYQVNLFGKVNGDPNRFKKVENGDKLRDARALRFSVHKEIGYECEVYR